MIILYPTRNTNFIKVALSRLHVNVNATINYNKTIPFFTFISIYIAVNIEQHSDNCANGLIYSRLLGENFEF